MDHWLASAAAAAAAAAAAQIGLGVVNGDTTIVRMDGSGGKFFVTNDANCGQPITASAYTTTFSYLYVCGQCKGGCPQVDGGESACGATSRWPEAASVTSVCSMCGWQMMVFGWVWGSCPPGGWR
jgi:hypothetical protein